MKKPGKARKGPRAVVLQVCVTVQEQKAFIKAAKLDGRTLSSWLRYLAVEKTRP